MSEQVVDPMVSRLKFDREVSQFCKLKDQYIKRGWWLLKADFPEVLVAFTSPKTKPHVVAFGALLDFTNYDLWPPSVKLVNPYTQAPYKTKEIPVQLLRHIPNQGDTTEIPNGTIQVQQLLQTYSPDDIPFVCLPGVKEYHDNPGHTGDSWLLHRGNGEGTLFFIIEQLSKYGLQLIQGLSVNVGFAIDTRNVST